MFQAEAKLASRIFQQGEILEV